MANELALKYQPYASQWCEITPYYERYGPVVVRPGDEVFLYVFMPNIEQFRYLISNKMRVYDCLSNAFISIRIDSKSGYKTIELFDIIQWKHTTNLLHRIYMLTFCYYPGCESMDVNHIDGNTSNCVPWNLEWLSHDENLQHSNRYIKPMKLSDVDVANIIRRYNNGNAVRDIAADYNVSTGYIMDIVRPKEYRDSTRMKLIRDLIPVTRERFKTANNMSYIDINIPEDQRAVDIFNKYNSGYSIYQLSDEYGVQIELIKDILCHYAQRHPEIVLDTSRFTITFTNDQLKAICELFEEYCTSLDLCNLVTYCISTLGLPNHVGMRKALREIYTRETYRDFSKNYAF